MTFSAQTILEQLGGNKFIAMTGAKNFVKDEKGKNITFKIGRNPKSISHVRIKLNVWDTYDIEFLSIRKYQVKIKDKVSGIYGDQLQEVFTRYTGLETTLGTMGYHRADEISKGISKLSRRIK